MNRKTIWRMLSINAAIAALTPVLILAKTIYVSPRGGGSSCTSSRPCSLKKGIDKAKSGDTVKLKNGTYGDNLVTRSDRVRFEAESRGKAVISTTKSPIASIK